MIDRIDNNMKIFSEGNEVIIYDKSVKIKRLEKDPEYPMYFYFYEDIETREFCFLNSDVDFDKTLKAMGAVGIAKDKDNDKIVIYTSKIDEFGNNGILKKYTDKTTKGTVIGIDLKHKSVEILYQVEEEIEDDTYFLGYGKDGLPVLIKDEQYIQALGLACEMNREAVVRQETIVDLQKELNEKLIKKIACLKL